MALTGSYVSLSRSKLGPDPEPAPLTAHRRRHVERDGPKFRALCVCGWSTRRSNLEVAQEALAAHITQRS